MKATTPDVKFIRLRIELCQKITPATTTGTWTEEGIRHQPRAWIRSLANIDALRFWLNKLLEPYCTEDLQIILTRATSAFIGDIIAVAGQPYR